MKIIIALLVLAALVGLFVRFANNRNAKKRKFYKDFGLRHGMVYSEVKGFLTIMSALKGNVQGVDVVIQESVAGSSSHSYVGTTIMIHLQETDFNFTISKEGFISKTAELLGFQDVKIGVEELDKKFMFMSDDEEKFRNLFDASVQHELKGLSKHLKRSIQLKRNQLSYRAKSEWYNQKKWDELDRVLKFMLLLTRNSKNA